MPERLRWFHNGRWRWYNQSCSTLFASVGGGVGHANPLGAPGSTVVRIEILAFERESDSVFRVSMRVGQTTTSAQIVEEPCDDDIVGFNFANDTFFALVLFYCGLDKRFNEDFGRFRSGETLSFPLDYGHAEQDGVNKAIAAAARLATRNG